MTLRSSRRLLVAVGLAAFALVVLQHCGQTELLEPALFTNEDSTTEFDVDFGPLAGNIDAKAFQSLLLSPDLFVEASYLPTKAIWPINAYYETRWASYLPIPSWVLTPREKTVRLKPSAYQVSEQHHMHFKADRDLSLYYALKGARIRLPALTPILNWPNEPLTLNIRLAFRPESADETASGERRQPARFVFDSLRYAAAGSVRASNARVLIDSLEDLTTDIDTVAARSALVGSKYSGYLKMLSNFSLREELPERSILDAYFIQERLRNPPDCSRGDSPGCCCLPGPAQSEAAMAEYRTLLARYRQATDWKPTDLRFVSESSAQFSEAIEQVEQIHAKTEGRLLDLLTFQTPQGRASSIDGCADHRGYRLFFVDRRLVDYQLESRSCLIKDDSRETLTRAKWNDQGQAVYFHHACVSCKNAGAETSADEATWTAMTNFGGYLAANVLRSPDVLMSPGQNKR